MSDQRETLDFQTEVRQLLQLMIHSLYSNKEIFLRELISNASDAADRLRFEALASPELLGEDAELGIRIEIDKKEGQLSVIDNGIGMSRDELIENLGTIAKSGTADFLQQTTGDEKHDANLIGQFGVGFYSAFIVADRVSVESRRAGLDADGAVRWESTGQGEFSIENIERAERGTRVTLHLKDDASEFAESFRIESLSRKYSDHIGFPVSLHQCFRIEIDKKEGQLSVIDNGIGMSRDELIENLGTIAKSGTADFLQQTTGDEKHDANLIGQFGVGFYSAFIVADRVSVESRRAGLDADGAVRWESTGQGEFSIENIERAERGTRVTLHLKDDASEFAESFRIESLIRKYSDHIGFPVSLHQIDSEDDSKVVNSATALWTRSRSDVSDDEYKEFYKHLSHDFSDPLTWSHNKVEGKRDYTSMLFIPGSAPFDMWNREAPRGLKLYVQRVFIMDDAEQFLPLYLRFVKGVVDSSDLPLNVSREMLQKDPDLTAMKGALTRRVLDMLSKLANAENNDYQKFWDEFGQVLKEGLVEDHASKDKLAKLLRFATTHNGNDSQDQSLADYLERSKGDQDKIYYILAENYATAVASPHLEQLRSRGIEVLLLTDRIDAWLADSLAEHEGKALVDVARAALELPDDANQACCLFPVPRHLICGIARRHED